MASDLLPWPPLWCETAEELLTGEGRWDKKEITGEVREEIEQRGGKRRGKVEGSEVEEEYDASIAGNEMRCDNKSRSGVRRERV